LPPPEWDGLPAHPTKAHSSDKLYYWSRITQAFARATKTKWTGRRACIDLHSSNGVNYREDTGTLEWGTSLLALQVFDPFDMYVFGDIDPTATSTLARRAAKLQVPGATIFELELDDPGVMLRAADVRTTRSIGPKVVIITGDANKAPAVVKHLLPAFPGQRLALTLVDPYGATFTWDALGQLLLHERMDAMILFPEDMDIERNISRRDQRFDSFFPGAEWFEIAQQAGRPGRELREYYKRELSKQHDHKWGDDVTVRIGPNGAELYKLLYAAKHERGVQLWNDTSREKPDGQLGLYIPGV
jgi:three-Cys-motif partner protein